MSQNPISTSQKPVFVSQNRKSLSQTAETVSQRMSRQAALRPPPLIFRPIGERISARFQPRQSFGKASVEAVERGFEGCIDLTGDERIARY